MTPGKWPFQGDSIVARARKMALAYRNLAREHRDLLCAIREVSKRLDKRLVGFQDPTTEKMLTELLARIGDQDPVDALDDRFRAWGEEWHHDKVINYGPDDYVNAKVAGNLVQIQAQTINRARRRGRVKGKWVSGKGSGKAGGWYYKVADVYAFSENLRTRGLHPHDETDTVHDNGSSDAE